MERKRKYKAHCENLRTIEIALKEIESSLKDSIKKEEHDRELIYTRLQSFLLGCWIDVRLSKLIHEPNAFTDSEIELILSKSSLIDSWKIAINIAVAKKCGIKFVEKNIVDKLGERLPFAINEMYLKILGWVDEYLKELYEIRNKVAHGQWVKAFTNNLSGFSAERTRDIKTTNIVTLQLEKSILLEISYLLESLCASNVPKKKIKVRTVFEEKNTAFEKKFEKSYKRIKHLRSDRQADRNYEDYKINLIAKYKRGQEYKKKLKITV